RQIDVAGNVSNGTDFHFTLDTKAPATPLVTLTHDTANGADNSDLLTNNSAITVSPVAEPLTREYSVDGGSWVNSYSAPTADGSHTVQVRDTDLAGNSATGNLTFNLDSTPPVAPGVVLANDTGSSSADNISSMGGLKLTGLESGAVVEYSINGGHDWSQNFNAVEGVNNLLVRQIDLAGNISSTAGLNFTLDTIAPTVPIISLAVDSTDGAPGHGTDLHTNNPAIVVTAANETVNREYSVDGSLWSNSYTPPTSEQSHTVLVRDTDVAGNSATGTLTFTLDTTPPVAPHVTLSIDSSDGLLNHGSDLVTNSAAISVTASTEPVVREYSVDGGFWSSNYSMPGNDGVHTVTVRDTDAAGNSSSGSLKFTLDTTVATPVVTLAVDSTDGALGHDSDLRTNNAAINVSLANETVSREYNVDNKGWSSSYNAPTADGSHTVQVQDTDVAGNKSNVGALSFVLDTTPPVPPSISLAVDTGVSNSDGLTSISAISVTAPQEAITREYSTDGSSWSKTYLPPSQDGLHTIQVHDLDAAGNTSGAGSLTFTLDTTPPVPTITLDHNIAGDGILSTTEANGNIWISGKVGLDARPGDLVTLTVNGVDSVGTVKSDKTFSISVNGNDLVMDTDHRVDASVSSVDAAGNVGRAYDAEGYTVDIPVPVPTITLDHNVAGDSIVNLAESQGPVAITGMAGGDAKSGDIVTLTVNGKDFTGLVQTDHSFSISVSGSDLVLDSDHLIDAGIKTSGAGQPGISSDHVSYGVDVSPPVPTIKLDSITADSIINSVEASGNVAVTGTVSGDALVGDTVTLTVNGKTYTDHVSVQNSFNFSISGNELINDPDHKVEVSISTADAAGNHGTAADSAAYAVDITPPVPTIDLSLSTVTSDNILNLAESHGSVTITGTVGGEAKAGDMVTLTLASGSFTANFNGVVQADNKSFSIDVLGNALATDADSKIEATVTSIDAAGNKGIASATLSYGVDITPPVPTISLEHNIAVDGVVNLAESKGTVAVTGTAGGDAVAGSTVVLTVNGVDFTGTVKSDGSFSVDVAGSNLAADHIIHASTTIVDTAGNPGTATDAVTYTVDVTPPNPTVTLDHNITGDGVVNVIDASSPVAVTGSVGGDAKPGDTVTLELNSINYSGTVDSNGKFSIIVPGSELVADTTHSIEASIATSVDAAGNLSLIGKDSVSYTVDTTPPSFDQALYTSPYFKVDMNGSHVVGAPVGSHDASPVGQATHDVIYGTSGNDTIDHNPAFSANPGQWSKTIHFTFTNLSEISSMEIIASPAVSGIPGFDLQGAGITHDSVNQNRWIITPTADSTHNGLDVNIVYDVTYNPEQVDFTATAHVIGSAGSLHQDLTNTLNFSWHEASTVTDFTQTTASGDPVMVLPSSGMGVFIYAGAGDDIIHAGASNDIIEGGAGKDFMDGGSGNNTATYEHSSIDIHVSLTDLASFNTGEAFGDTYLNIQNLTGSLHDDYLIGDSGVNILKGGAGNDILEGMGGADILDGGSGSNAASYEHSAASVTVSLADKSLNTGDARGDQFVSIQNLIGSTHDDILMGDSGDNTIKGGDGNDTLEGMGGNNILDGGSGSNTASYEHSTSGIHASLADHTFNTGDAVGDSYVNIQNLTGTSRADILIGDKYDNILSGGEGNDILEGMAGADTLDGGDGVNTASYEHASEGVTAVLYDSSKNFGTDAIGDKYLNIQNLTGSSHDDVLIGDSSSNNMKGGDGNDVLEGMAGADTLDGGAGVDTASYAHAVVGVTAALDPAFAELQTGSAYGDSFINIENLTGSNSADILIGNSGANYIFGGNGNDTLEGLGGADTLDGGTGINTASYEHATTGVVASLTTTFTDGVAVTQTGDAEGDTFINIRHLAGSTFNDTLIGDSNDNIINGLGGSDILEGMGGADTLIGSVDGNNTASYEHSTTGVTASLHNHSDNLGADAAGDTYTNIQNLTGSTHNDIFIGDSNANIFDGGAGIDTVSYDYDTKGVIVSLSAAFTSIESGEAKGDLFINVENLIGSSGNDLLFGDNGMNALYGGGGDDILEGLGGSDHLDGGGGKNTASYEHASASVIASLTTVFTDGSAVITAGDAAGDTYENIQNLTGSTHDDILIGDSGDNLISGLAGSDILEGMGGADTLIGSIEGNNTASYEHSISGVQVSLTDHSSNTGDAQGDTYINIQNLTGSTHDDILIGDSGNNIFNGMGGNDILEGMGGADKLIGVAGGNATASYEHSDAGVYVSLDANVAHGGHAEGDTFLNVQNLTGSTHDDILIGDIGRNILSGMGGNDILEGLGGADTLIGGLDGHATASYEHSLTGVTAALYDSNRNIGDDAVGDSYTNIHNLTGSSHDDMLIGDSYANIFNGGTGIDTVSYEYTSSGVTASLSATYTSLEAGEAQGDIFHNVENLIGSSHDDILIGDSGDNALYGGAGNDILEGMGGQNILDGGTGNNTASYEHSTLGVHASLSNYSFNTNDAAGDTYVLGTIQNLTGSTHDDILSGDGVANIFNGIGGSDQFEGLGGADTFMGSVDGSNTVTYEHASTAVTASLHDSSINNGIDASGDTYTNIQNLTGSSYNDILIGDSHANIFDGGAGIDTVSYDYASGVIVSLTTGLVTEAGEATGDIFHNVENLTGSAFNDIIIGDSGNNMLLGGDGNDILEGMGGINILDGGSGNNTVSYEHSILGVHASLSNHAFNTNDAAGDTYVSGTIQNLTGSTHNDILIGDTSANVLSGLGGNDIFEGLGGVDTLIGVAGGNATASYEHSLTGVTAALYDSASRNLGADAIGDKYINIQNLTGSAYADTLIGDSHANIFDGGAGIDTVSYDYASAGIKASLTAGLVTETGDATGDIFHNVENLTGSSFDDFLIGDSGINILRGGAGNDILEGMGGADIFDGGIGNNTASYEHANGAVICNLYQNKGYGGDALNDTYSNIQNLIGSRFADNLTGDNNDNIINGGLGDNVMVGLGGADTFIGGDDFDKVSYNSAFDIDAGNGVTVSLSSDYTYLETGDAKGDLFFGIEKVEGTTGDDYLIGDDNNNVFTGNSGDDVLEGLGGADELYGNGGNNTASYQHSHEGVTASLSSTPADNINTGDAAGDYYNNIQNLLGSNFDDTLVGDGQNNILTGGGGNDSIYLYNPQAPSQSVGNDTAYGGAANDTFYVSAVLSTDPLNLPTLIDGGSSLGGEVNTLVLQGLVSGS
ncbi:MAG: Ig-like domain-containing protein, partial [Geobacteraceae bacterium]|nr:Ig-like domain-containing protein [Geobacteraceae bacterium]